MKLGLALLILGLSSAFSTQAEAQQMGHGHGTTTSFVYKNLTFQYQLSDDDFKHTPSWNPETDESPLPTRKALEVARVNLHRFVQDADRFEVEKINLESLSPTSGFLKSAFIAGITGVPTLP